jgi:hypothetical protein
MNPKTRIRALLFALLCAALLYGGEARSSEQEIGPAEYDFHLGAKLGSLLPIGPDNKDFGFSIVTGLLADVRFAKYFSIGGFFTFFYTQYESGESWEEKWGTMSYTAVGGTLKVHIEVAGILEIRPGLSLGWGVTQSISTWDDWGPGEDVVESPSGPYLGVSIEVSYYIRKHLGLLFEFGAMYYHGDGIFVMHQGTEEEPWDEFEPLFHSFSHLFYINVGVEYGGLF